MAIQNVPSVDAVKNYIEQKTITEWDATITYAADELALESGQIYRSLVGSNLNNQPSVSPTEWVAITITESEVNDIALALAIALG